MCEVIFLINAVRATQHGSSFEPEGFSVVWTLSGGTLVAAVYCWRHKVSLGRALDLGALPIPLGLAIGRRWTGPADDSGDDALRMTLGADRSFVLAGRNVYVVVEYQRDGFGAGSSEELLETFVSVPARRGEMQVYGRDEMVVQGSVELHPLVSADALMVWNLNDPSVLLGPGVSYAAAGEVSLRGGLYFGVGSGTRDAGLPGSEFGIVPTTGYASLTWFF